MLQYFKLYRNLIIQILVFTVTIIDVGLSVKHTSHIYILKNITVFCTLTGLFLFYYLKYFLIEQLNQTNYKSFSINLAISTIITISISAVSHYKYVPFIILCFLISFLLCLYLFTLNLKQHKQTTLTNFYNNQNNSFTLIRFILASMVLVGHFGLHGGNGPFISTGLTFNIFEAFQYEGNFAVYLFFIISGFFMIQSLQHSNNTAEYLIKRFLRIFPLFLLLHLISFLGTHNIAEFILSFTLNAFGGGWHYNMNYEPTFYLDFNSSWTLKNEFLCYILLLLFYTVANTKRIYLLLITIFFVIVDLFFFIHPAGRGYLGFTIFIIDPKMNFDLVSFLPLFLVSASIYQYKDKIPVSKHTILFAFSLLAMFMFFNDTMAKTLGLLILMPYLLITLCSVVKIQLWTKIGDYSYGIYLIHPIVYNNLGNYFFPHYQRNLQNLIIVYVITLILAIVSWHLLEKPAMKLKRVLCK